MICKLYNHLQYALHILQSLYQHVWWLRMSQLISQGRFSCFVNIMKFDIMKGIVFSVVICFIWLLFFWNKLLKTDMFCKYKVWKKTKQKLTHQINERNFSISNKNLKRFQALYCSWYACQNRFSHITISDRLTYAVSFPTESNKIFINITKALLRHAWIMIPWQKMNLQLHVYVLHLFDL